MKTLLILILCVSRGLCMSMLLHHHHHSNMYDHMSDPQEAQCVYNSASTENITVDTYVPISKCMQHCHLQKNFEVYTNGTPIIENIPVQYRKNLTECISQQNATKGDCSKSVAYSTCWNMIIDAEEIKQQIACNAQKKMSVAMVGKRVQYFEYKGCYRRCSLIKRGLMNAKNELVVKKLAGLIPKRALDLEAIATGCNKLANKETDVCEVAISRHDCFVKKTTRMLEMHVGKLESYLD